MKPDQSADERPARSGAARMFDRACRNPRTGEVVIAQRPNAPLIVFVLASGARALAQPTGRAGDALSLTATAALVWWSADELVRGDSLFRRGLGATVLAATVAQRLGALR